MAVQEKAVFFAYFAYTHKPTVPHCNLILAKSINLALILSNSFNKVTTDKTHRKRVIHLVTKVNTSNTEVEIKRRGART